VLSAAVQHAFIYDVFHYLCLPAVGFGQLNLSWTGSVNVCTADFLGCKCLLLMRNIESFIVWLCVACGLPVYVSSYCGHAYSSVHTCQFIHLFCWILIFVRRCTAAGENNRVAASDHIMCWVTSLLVTLVFVAFRFVFMQCTQYLLFSSFFEPPRWCQWFVSAKKLTLSAGDESDYPRKASEICIRASKKAIFELLRDL